MSSSQSTTTMNAKPYRRGHAAISAILQDMEPYLPADTINRPGYAGCRTTYGMMTVFHKRAESSATPEKEYKELQQLERDLRRRLHGLDATKGIPEKMTTYLDELKAAIDDALTQGVGVDFLIKGLADVLMDSPDAQTAPKPERVKMVPETKLRKVREELKIANERIRKLNLENNGLAIRVKQLEMERGT